MYYSQTAKSKAADMLRGQNKVTRPAHFFYEVKKGQKGHIVLGGNIAVARDMNIPAWEIWEGGVLVFFCKVIPN